MEELVNIIGQMLAEQRRFHEEQIEEQRRFHEEQIEAERDRTARLFELLRQEPKQRFLHPDEVCRLLGIRIGKSTRHRDKLKYYRDHGFLTKFGSQNPITYDVDEVNLLAIKIKSGKVIIPRFHCHKKETAPS